MQLRDAILKVCEHLENATNSIRAALTLYIQMTESGQQKPIAVHSPIEALLSKISWKESMGAKGPFMLASDQDNAAIAEYHELHKILSETAKGNLFHGTRFIWLLNTETGGIGMKEKAGKK